MEENVFREIVEAHLLPMFSRAELEPGSHSATYAHQPVAHRGPQEIFVSPDRRSPFRLVLRRNQPFDSSEFDVISTFIELLSELAPLIDSPFAQDITKTFVRRVIARVVEPEAEEVLLDTLDHFATLSSRLYEGKPISAAVGFVTSANDTGPRLSECWKEDYSAVLTNGIDTLITANFRGRVLRYVPLNAASNDLPFAPDRFSRLANWATNRKICVSLTRSGEIPIFKDQMLVFARRGGLWKHFTHQHILTQMGCPQDIEIRRAIYASALDVSFSKSGGGIAVVSAGNTANIRRYVNDDDIIAKRRTNKTQFLQKTITEPFHQIDRRVRQELIAVDGSTVLNHEGFVIAVGAIVTIPGGSTSGGRRAAAIALSNLGLGVKISQDGGISGFRAGVDAPAFSV